MLVLTKFMVTFLLQGGQLGLPACRSRSRQGIFSNVFDFTALAVCSAGMVLLGLHGSLSVLLGEHCKYIGPDALLSFYKEIKYYFLVGK